jgi:putative FmdB family regulatory protein
MGCACYNFRFEHLPGGSSVPLYEYKCLKCGRHTEKIESVSGPHLKKCPHCGGKVESLISAPAIKFKGSGWYVNDYAGKSSASEPGKSDASGDGAGSAKDSGAKDGKDSSSKESSAKETSSKESKKTAKKN